jgi:hypothetical protein
MCHITTWEEDYKGNNTSPSLQSPLANSSSPSCIYVRHLSKTPSGLGTDSSKAGRRARGTEVAMDCTYSTDVGFRNATKINVVEDCRARVSNPGTKFATPHKN